MDSERLSDLHGHTELKSKGSILFGTKSTPRHFSVPLEEATLSERPAVGMPRSLRP